MPKISNGVPRQWCGLLETVEADSEQIKPVDKRGTVVAGLGGITGSHTLDAAYRALNGEPRPLPVEGPVGEGAASQIRAKATLPTERVPRTGIKEMSPQEARKFGELGYTPRAEFWRSAFADQFMLEVNRLIDEGLIQPAKDRVMDGVPTEFIVNLGEVWGNGADSELMRASPLLRRLLKDLQRLGDSYNRNRPYMIAAGMSADEVPEIATRGAELNVNVVLGAPGRQWTGLHPHLDNTRFTAGLKGMEESSVRHDAIKARG